MHVFLVALLLLVTASACGALAYHALLRRSYVDARILAAFLIGAALASASYAFDLLSPQLALKTFFHQVYYLGSVSVALSALLYALWYTRQSAWLGWPRILCLILPPTAAWLFQASDPWHHLHYARVWLDTAGPLPLRHSSPGPLYWFPMLVANTGLIAAVLLLANQLPKSRGKHRLQLKAMLVVMATPTIANLAYVAGVRPWGWLNVTPFGYALTGLVFSRAVRYAQLLDLRPVAREVVIQRIPMAVIVLDAYTRVVEANQEASRFLGEAPDQIIGLPLRNVAAHCPELLALISPVASPTRSQFSLVQGKEQRFFEAEVSPLDDTSQEGSGWVLLIRDVTVQKQVEEERTVFLKAAAANEEKERLLRQLRDGLGQVIGYLHVEVQKAHDYWEKGQPALAEATLAHLSEVAADAHADLRDFVLGIPVEQAADRGFLPTLQRYVERAAATMGLSVQLRVEGPFAEGEMDPRAETQFLSIIKEALSNVNKHAGVNQADVFLSRDAGRVRATIRDEGRGFDLNAVMSLSGHAGLDIMRDRVAKAGGILQVVTAPGKGTQVIVDLPAAGPPPGVRWPELRVVLADDHPLFREGLHTLLAARSIQVVGEAANGQEAVDLARQLTPDLVLLDLNMPGMDGFQALHQIKAQQPDLPVVILTVDEGRDALQRAMQLGANGYLLKTLDANDFFRALERVVRGEKPISPRLTDIMLSELNAQAVFAATGPRDDPLDALTPRQREILAMIARDVPYKNIARDLCLSEPTIKYHVARILERLGVDSRAQAVDLLRRGQSSLLQ